MASHTKENLDQLINIYDRAMKYVEGKISLATKNGSTEIISIRPKLWESIY